MESPYHTGELAIQKQAGVQAEALKLVNGISSTIKPAAKEFLENQRLAIAATIDANDTVWASLLTGESGFLQVLANQSVKINAVIIPSELINKNLQPRFEIGLLVIDLLTRRRLRVNGIANVQPDNSIYVQTKQVYFNCPKYIQQRHLITDVNQLSPKPAIARSHSLNLKQQQLIAQADTFFIASFYPESGADASHRGGYPGFVHVVNSKKLVFPDYSGNNMFNTLGNISLNPQIGLLFVDFGYGSTLNLTGKADIIWNMDVADAGAERLVEFHVEQVVEIVNATRLRWKFGEFSPFNPE